MLAIVRCVPNYVLFLLAVMLLTTPSWGQDRRVVEMGRWSTAAEESLKAGKHREATVSYSKARQLAVQVFGANHIYVAAFAQAEGVIYIELGEYEKAAVLVEQGLKISESVRDQEFEAEALNNLATIKWYQAQYLESQKLHERGLAALVKAYGANDPNVAVSRGNIAGVYKALGQYVEAEPFYHQSIKVLRANQPKYALHLADGLMNFADLYAVQGQFPTSELLLLESVQIKERSLGVNHYEVGRTLNNLAALYFNMGQYEKAEAMHRRTLKLLETGLGADHIDVSRTLLNLAIACQRQQKFDEAEPFYARALSIRQKKVGKDHPDTALALHNMGSFYLERKDYPRARELYSEALKIRKDRLGADHPSTAYTLMNIGHLEHCQSNYEAAEKLFQEALKIREARLSQNHPDLAYCYGALAKIEAATERWDDSAHNFDRARRGFRKHVDQVLPSLSETDQLTFLKEIDEPHLHSALSLVVSQPEREVVIALSANWVLNGKGVAQQALSQRALIARDTSNPLLAGIVKSLLQIRKQLASLTLVSDAKEGDAERQKRIEELSRQEQDKSQQLAQQGGRPPGSALWIETAQVRQSLKKESVLIEIARFKQHDSRHPKDNFDDLPQRYIAWIIPAAGPEKIRIVDLGEAEKIDECVREARAALQDAPAVIREQGEPEAELELKPALQRLAEKILHPLVKDFPADQTIYLSPDSSLWLVPWSALPLEGGEYAIEKFDLRFLVSGRDLVRAETKSEAGKPVVFADPDYNLDPTAIAAATKQVLRGSAGTAIALRAAAPSGKFKLGTVARLPGTKTEADAVRPHLESFAGKQAIVYSGQWALEAMFKQLHQPRVLVLSTHGFFQEEQSNTTSGDHVAAGPSGNPLLRCGLLLAGCNKPVDTSKVDGEDGILTGLEIVSTDLRGTELVVLSACETGLGEVRNGEGVAGLRQAFQLAGASTIVSTLWQIPDRETAKLMASFFTGLADTGDKSRSLRNAQLKLMEGRRERNGAAHPFFWAAFTLTGE